ncbi:MAG: aspartate/glutamate racemase family protein [Pseudomonadota bacterium]
MPRIALIHATRVAIDPIENAAGKLWPEAETVSILEEGLSADRQKSKDLSAGLRDRIVSLARYAESITPDGILFTCSAFGPAIEAAAKGSPVPIMKPNEAMFDAALALGTRIAMIFTFPPSAPSLEDEFRDAAAARGGRAVLTSYFCDGALDAKRQGDDAAHDRLVAETAGRIADADAIMLAQFSMAGAANEARRLTNMPVLTSPESAITEIRRRVEAKESLRAC